MAPSTAMKLLHEAEEATKSRKLIKSQVEKRRRERMNRSLERLRTMLLHEPREGGPQHRVEKAEILEHTILFLQRKDRTQEEKMAGGGGGRKRAFQDGFSACLQRAARFLGPEGKGLQLGPALNAAFAARLARSDSHPAGLQSRNFLPHAKFILRMLRHKSKLRLRTRASGEKLFVRPYPLPLQQRLPRKQRESEIRADTGATKQSSPQSSPACQTLWRPWP